MVLADEGGKVPGVVAVGLSFATRITPAFGALRVPVPWNAAIGLAYPIAESPSLRALCSANDAKATAFSGQCECFAPFEPLSLITPDASRDSRRYRRKAFGRSARN